MSLAVSNRNFFLKLQLLKYRRLYVTSLASVEDEYTKTPQYPEIVDLAPFEVKKQDAQDYYETIKAVKTVEEKQIKLNMPKYYGFKCFMLHENAIPYNNLNLTQYLTKTHLIENNQLPIVCPTMEHVNLEALKRDVEDVLILAHEGYCKNASVKDSNLTEEESQNAMSSIISQQIHRAILLNLHVNYPHLEAVQTDIDPRIESCWFSGGIPSNQEHECAVTERKDKAVQYVGVPTLTVRSEVPLSPIISFDEAKSTNFNIPNCEYQPQSFGVFTTHRRIVNVPGFWPGDPYQFGLLAYHYRGHILRRRFKDPVEHQEALHRQGILAGFGWLNAQANFLGFSTYNDITYPLVTQCVVTNGKMWSFYAYQLNTMLMHLKYIEDNSKVNICWGSKELKLYEEIQNGKVIGFNEDVLKMLVSFYTNVPRERSGVELRPFLGDQEKVIADLQDDERREWLEKEYKFITSNRPRHYLPYEIYHWEKIYKIDHKKRPMDARRRPFELFINPWDRTYNSRKPRYIPRKHRPDVKRHVGRDAKEYFP
uniref:28S ribosomal protein S30, mitochondrial n=1 Tax=Photinus pyralis TaxID=7054 RepID=A0A1Y1M8U9_PHOPY